MPGFGSSISKAAVVFISITCAAAACAQELPNAIDLKAAYCIRLISEASSAINKLRKEFPTDDLQIAKEFDERASAFMSYDSRLRAYLVPRMPSLEMVGILAAANQATADANDSKKILDKCAADRSASMCQNISSSFFSKKLESCEELSWLPF